MGSNIQTMGTCYEYARSQHCLALLAIYLAITFSEFQVFLRVSSGLKAFF